MNKLLGVMLDCSRSAVMNVETVKNYAKIIKQMGYNTLMLYTEDTYEIDSQPYFGHLRGRYTKAELKEIDDFCDSIGIEVIPCIQTLAHLENMFRWEYAYGDVNDCDNILLIDEEKTYQLIEDMFKTLSECFRSRKIHIGMDEADRVGTGKYQQLHGIEDRFEIMNKHLHKVCQIADKYQYEPMIWSDMFCRFAFDLEGQYDDADRSKILEKSKLPENISLVYWDYYSADYEHYVKQIRKNKLFGRPVYFAGGAWTWGGFAPDNKFSIATTAPALAACNDEGVDGIFMTMWGDNGSECSKFAVLPSLMYAAECSSGYADFDSIKEKFKAITGCDFDSFMLLDALDTPGRKHEKSASKYLLYNDLFLGIRDHLCSIEDNAYYANLAEKIRSIQEKGAYAYLFESYEKQAEVLSIKAALGIQTRAAYLEKDIPALREIIKEYAKLSEKLQDFHASFQKRWFTENKPHGFDVHDIRLGGLMQRVKSCKERLEQFVLGAISSIPELEEPVLERHNGKDWWPQIASPNSLHGI